MTLFLAIVMAAFGVAVAGYLVLLLWNAAFGPLSHWLESSRLKRREELAARGDATLRDGEVTKALVAFSRAFYWQPSTSSAGAAAIARHHTGLLSRFIAASDQSSGGAVGLLSLAATDRILKKRKELQSAYVGAIQTGDRRRQQRVKGEMAANSAELRAAVDELCAEIVRLRGGSTLH